MPYIIHKIIPFNTSGTFIRNGITYNFQFTHSTPDVGHLYVYAGVGGLMTENLYVLTSLENRDFTPVFEKLKQIYKDNKELKAPLQQYQVLITGSNVIPDDGNTINFVRYINVYFTATFKKVVLPNGEEIELHEGDENITSFIKNINSYSLG